MCLNSIQRQDVAEIVLGDIDIDLALSSQLASSLVEMRFLYNLNSPW